MIKFILKSKEFVIPESFPYFNDVKSDIYDILITKHQYEVQSNVTEEVFQAFLDHWTIKKLPKFNENNISEYAQLSEEFDLMRDLIQMYHHFAPQITNLEQQLDETKNNLEQNQKYYKEIYDIVCEFPEIEGILKRENYNLRDAFENQDIEYIKLYRKQKVQKNGILYVLDDESYTAGTIAYTKDDDDLFIPRSIQHNSKEYVVTVVHKKSFKNFDYSIQFAEDSQIQIIDDESFYGASITDIKIPSKVKKIGKKAFMKCQELEEITFSENSELQIIEENAFTNSGIKHILIPENVKQICDHAFECKLNKIEFSINSKLEKIGDFAFKCSAIECFSIPPNVVQIGEGSFKNTNSLKSIDVMEGNCHFCSIENNKYIVGKSDPKSDKFDTIIFANRDIEEANIPSNIKRIECYSFNLCRKLQKVTFSENSELEFIGKLAFANSGLKAIKIPPKVTSIDKMCFYKATELETVEIMEGNCHFCSIENNKCIVGKSDPKSDKFDTIIFANSDIEEANIPSNIKRIECYSFNLCRKLQKVTFSENSELEFIGKCSFSQSILTRVDIPPLVTTIGEKSFENCEALQEVTFSGDSQLRTLGKMAFSSNLASSSLTRITIPSSVTSIEKYCFSNCSKLIEVTLSDDSKLEFIGKCAFDSTGIESITIPKHVSKIDKGAFNCCKSLKKVEFSNDSKLKIIDDEAFRGCSIESITIPIHVIKIGNGCFYQCSELKNVNFAENSELEILGNSAFRYTKIESITIPPRIKKLTALNHTIKNVYFPENSELTEFKSFCFADSHIEEIKIPPTVKIIEESCFQLCYSLQKVEFSENSQLHTIGECAFYYSGIKNIVIPPHVTRIQSCTFETCNELESVSFSEGSELKVIETDAFSGSSIQHLYIPASVIEFQDGWLNNTPELIDIQISPENKVFQTMNEQIILKKSKENGIFDIISFVFRNIEKVIIPPYIKVIGNSAFSSCNEIKTIEFEKNSNLENICDFAFSESGIENITIPSSVTSIEKCAFSDCENLKRIEFENNSKLKTLGENALARSSIESLSIPSSIEKFCSGWCFSTPNLTSITIIQNPIENIHYFNDQLILGKSDPSLPNFNTIIIALRDVKKVTIPHFIEIIEPYAFNNCMNLNTIEFEKNSQLKFIGVDSFSHNDSLKRIDIPSSVEIIDDNAFSCCNNLKCVTFSQDSNLKEIHRYVFNSTSVSSFYIPSHATTFSMYNIQIIEIDENTELTELNMSSFLFFDNVEILMVPSHLKIY